ncbi:hypothetical protein AK812_SmicGene28964 [Symbiodinium microadriaticum]|uniref:Uncharacterized protein n=1 Tax=Symbiodinium microadriaticum TaxID=2951 RepID=A0A1Q9D322_SYMMI|nr:hypothetical protein AK812_SmicGene28964 [Symbiodinium microadriaticum]
MAALAWLLFSLAAGAADARHLRGLRGLSEDLGTMLREDVAKAASHIFKTFDIEGNPLISFDVEGRRRTAWCHRDEGRPRREGQGGLVSFAVEDLSVEVHCQYDLRLSSFGYKETGNVRARMFGDSMSLNFPDEGSGAGGCHFGKGLDLEVRSYVARSQLLGLTGMLLRIQGARDATLGVACLLLRVLFSGLHAVWR